MAKIAVLSFYSGVVDRGVETFVYELTKRLRIRHDITIFQAGQKITNPKIRTYQIKAFAKTPKASTNIFSKFYLNPQAIKILIFSLKASPQILKGKFDILILLNGGWQTVIFRVLSKFSGTKIIIAGQAGIGADDAFNIFFRPDSFVALTTSQYNWAKKITEEVNIALIPNGVNLTAFNPQIKPAKLSLKKPIVVTCAALVPYKRVDLTIRAAAKANISLLVLGDGQLAGSIDSLGKRLLGTNYLRLNPPYSQMASYYRSAQVFSLASQTEAFGIAYVEAMACNLPVVTTNDASRAEITGSAGILTDCQNTDQYAKDLLLALKTNYRNIPYDQALKYSWNKIAQKYSDLIKKLLN